MVLNIMFVWLVWVSHQCWKNFNKAMCNSWFSSRR